MLKRIQLHYEASNAAYAKYRNSIGISDLNLARFATYFLHFFSFYLKLIFGYVKLKHSFCILISNQKFGTIGCFSACWYYPLPFIVLGKKYIFWVASTLLKPDLPKTQFRVNSSYKAVSYRKLYPLTSVIYITSMPNDTLNNFA